MMPISLVHWRKVHYEALANAFGPLAFNVHIKEYEGKMLDQPSQMGISLSPDGRMIVRFLDKDGQKVTLDLTAAIEEIAERKVQEHMAKWHGHQI